MPKIKSINKASPDGTFLLDSIDTDYAKIVEKYGNPTTVDGYKSDAGWVIEWDDGRVGTIYNWKNGKNYLGKDGLEVNKIKDWNIGGKDKIVVKRIRDDLLNSWPIFDEIRQEVSE